MIQAFKNPAAAILFIFVLSCFPIAATPARAEKEVSSADYTDSRQIVKKETLTKDNLAFQKNEEERFRVEEKKQDALKGSLKYQLWVAQYYGWNRYMATREDRRESIKWWRMAAEQGSIGAQEQMAAYYSSGYYVQQNDEESAKWRLKAANQESSGSQLEMGRLYSLGLGVPKSDEEAYLWFLLAEESDRHDIADYCVRENIRISLTREQIEAVKKRAAEWKPLSGKKEPKPCRPPFAGCWIRRLFNNVFEPAPITP